MNKKRSAPAIVGGSSLLVIFTVLCLTVFALLSVATATADSRLSTASSQTVTDYYAADARAEEIFAQLRHGESISGGTDVAVTVEDGSTLYTYTVAIDEKQELHVELLSSGSGWRVLRWQAVSTADWVPNTDISVWSGKLQ